MKHMMTGTLAALALTGATTAMAAPADYSYTLTIDGTQKNAWNAPTFSLANTGNVGIKDFFFSIGDNRYNFDAILPSADNPISFQSNLDATNGGDRAEYVEFAFDGFDPGAVFEFIADVDPDNMSGLGEKVDNPVFFNNGDNILNSLVGVIFEDGKSLSMRLGDFDLAALNNVVTVNQDGALCKPGQPHVIPTPAAAMAGMGLLGLVGLKRRRA